MNNSKYEGSAYFRVNVLQQQRKQLLLRFCSKRPQRF